jgi:hypothetical protein
LVPTFDRLLSVPSLAYAVTPKYQVPDERLLTR